METPESTHIFCVTPVKNETWILDRFLQCASQWAHHIIVADQHSDDGSREMARQYPNVRFVENPSREYDEGARQRLLLDEARAIPVDGKRIIIALDADEMLTANFMTSPEWQRVLEAPPGTVISFQWVNIAPDLRRGWLSEDKPFGFVDDGKPHQGKKIHSHRLPTPSGAATLVMRDIKVLHYQYTDWQRMKSKQRWYQCWERINHPQKRPVQIYRQYHFMDVALEDAEPLRNEWFTGYVEAGIDMTSIPQEGYYRWDEDLVQFLQEYGVEKFRKLNVWDNDWADVGRAMGLNVNSELSDPRSWSERVVHQWLAKTQRRRKGLKVRAIQQVLRLMGW